MAGGKADEEAVSDREEVDIDLDAELEGADDHAEVGGDL